MVIDNASRLISFLEDFDPSEQKHFKTLEQLVKKYPHFHLVQPYFLKSVEQHQPESYDKTLSQTAIATYERQLLYEFLENPNSTIKSDQPKKEVIKPKKKGKKKTPTTTQVVKQENKIPKELPFSGWANYFKNNTNQPNKINEKFDLFDTFLEKKRKKPNKETANKDDLSTKSWASTDELMTETLAKVFVKQKKFENALQAYQILSLKYPEKNSFFADQIKEIKRIQKLKE